MFPEESYYYETSLLHTNTGLPDELLRFGKNRCCFAEHGLRKVNTMEEADMVIFNTCSVRQKAEDRVFGQMINIKKLRKEKPHLIAAITGCMVRTTSNRQSEHRDVLLRRSKETDFVFRIEDLPKLPELIMNVGRLL